MQTMGGQQPSSTKNLLNQRLWKQRLANDAKSFQQITCPIYALAARALSNIPPTLVPRMAQGRLCSKATTQESGMLWENHQDILVFSTTSRFHILEPPTLAESLGLRRPSCLTLWLHVHPNGNRTRVAGDPSPSLRHRASIRPGLVVERRKFDHFRKNVFAKKHKTQLGKL